MRGRGRVLARLREPSTWAGLGVAVTAVGVAVAMPTPETIGAAVAAVGAALAAVVLPEGKP